MHRRMFRTAALLMAIAVTLGAFGAHLLKKLLTPSLLEGYQTATYYQMIHAIAIFIAGFLYKQYHHKKMWVAGQLFFFGILCFSGSIYARVALSFAGYTSLGVFNLVTPLGGILFIMGWLWLLISIPGKTPDKQDVNKQEN
ncbi:MAG: hypothetical protein RLZZ520_346 [Bacteroidota bacterium]|jgi:uncharacterized membrane protein YgdD (TMEM256/DUF423 family)